MDNFIVVDTFIAIYASAIVACVAIKKTSISFFLCIVLVVTVLFFRGATTFLDFIPDRIINQTFFWPFVFWIASHGKFWKNKDRSAEKSDVIKRNE